MVEVETEKGVERVQVMVEEKKDGQVAVAAREEVQLRIIQRWSEHGWVHLQVYHSCSMFDHWLYKKNFPRQFSVLPEASIIFFSFFLFLENIFYWFLQ